MKLKKPTMVIKRNKMITTLRNQTQRSRKAIILQIRLNLILKLIRSKFLKIQLKKSNLKKDLKIQKKKHVPNRR